jgi:hypothetical protein
MEMIIKYISYDKLAIPQNGLTSYEAHHFFHVIGLTLHCMVHKTFKVGNTCNLSKWID